MNKSMPGPSHTVKAARPPQASQPFLEDIASWENTKLGYKQAMKGRKRHKHDAIRFERRQLTNLKNLQRAILAGEYVPGPQMHFIIHEKKTRVIDAPWIEDKIPQNMIHEKLLLVFLLRWVKSTFACIPNRGNLQAAMKIQRDMKLARLKWGEDCWIVKADIHHCFPSISHEILIDILAGILDDPRVVDLERRIILASPPMEEPGRGLPLGNVTNQDHANLVLSKLDNYVVRFKGIRFYTRYMDDMVAIVQTREEAQELLAGMCDYARKYLELEFNGKSKIFPLKQGVTSLGFRIFPDHMEVSQASIKAMKRRMKRLDEKLQAGEIDQERVQQTVESWLGYARWGNNFHVAQQLFAPYPYIQVEKPGFKFGDPYQKKRLLAKWDGVTLPKKKPKPKKSKKNKKRRKTG